MKNLKRIMVGIDVFAKSDNVLKRAFMLAKENKAELFIVQAIQTPWLSVPDYFSSKKIIVDTKGIKKKIEKKIKALNSDRKVPCFVLLKEGDADDVILYESKLLKVDMIVIGAHTKAKKRKNFLGSTAQKVAHRSHLPVLVVKNRVKDPYKNILAPTDFQIQSKQSILFTKNIFPASKIDIVHISETIYMDGPYYVVGRDLRQYNDVAKACAKKDLKELMKEVSVNKGKVIDGETDSKEVLLQYIKKNSYDLVVVGSRGTAGFNILLGSMASFILRETPTDVLVYVPID